MSTAIGGRRLILIAEDDPIIGMMLRDMVGMLGFEPAGPAGSIEAALHLIEAHPRLDAAILDCELGTHFVWPVADRLVTGNVPFIFSTGYRGVVPVRFAGLSILSKPYSLATLKTALTRAISSLSTSRRGKSEPREHEPDRRDPACPYRYRQSI